MSWFRGSSLNWFHSFFLRLLKCGNVPKHVAFIMDGNRRFARKNNVEKREGHSKGFDKLSETLQWCLDAGIEEVTVYAFSIENFKRSQEEVNDLLELTREKFKRLLEEKDKLMERGIRIRIIGNSSLLPADILQLIAEVELLTYHNTKSRLNVAFAYTSRDEMTSSVNLLREGLARGELEEGDLSLGLFNLTLQTRDSPPPQLIIRTSGEIRLSDFLLAQGNSSYLHFTGVLWPELSAWDFLWALFKYQVHSEVLEEVKRVTAPRVPLSPTASQFLSTLDSRRLDYLQRNATIRYRGAEECRVGGPD